MKPNLSQRLKNIKLLILDVDGVLTDGRIYKTTSGEEMLAFNVRDGMGIARLKEEGIEVALLSGRTSGAMMARAKELGIEKIFLGNLNKGEVLKTIIREIGVEYSEVAYIGDDLADIEAMKKVGLAAAVADAAPEVKAAAEIVLETRGGRGAAREMAEKILKARNRWIS